MLTKASHLPVFVIFLSLISNLAHLVASPHGAQAGAGSIFGDHCVIQISKGFRYLSNKGFN